jgi:fructose-1-phosphate kinase PfkB-like protein
VNVARVLQALGVRTRALVVIGGRTGCAIADDLEGSGIPFDALEAPGESRTCLEIVEPGGRATQLHGAGVDGAGELVVRVGAAVEALPEGFDWLALCGSLPPGMPTDAVARLGAIARGRGLRVAIDTGGPALAAAWRWGPDLVHVNDTELGDVLPDGAPARAPHASLGEARRGAVTRGAAPFEAWEEGRMWSVTPPAVDATNPIGCGDAWTAGVLAALAGKLPFQEALARGTALAAAEACSSRAGRPDLALAHRLMAQVKVAPLKFAPRFPRSGG